MVTDVVFVGGGVIGLAGARAAAARGLSAVVVDPAPGRGASWVAAGLLAPVSELSFGERHLAELLLAGAARWGTFAGELEEETGTAVGYRRCGALAVGLDGSDRAVIDDLLPLYRSLGLPADRLAASECRDLVPALSPEVRGGGHLPGDHQVDNRALVDALLAACRRAGVVVRSETVATVEIDRGAGAGAVRGVRLLGGERLAASTVVLSAGCRTACLGGVPPGTVPPVRPVKGHVLRLRGAGRAALFGPSVRGVVHGRPCYLVARGDGSLVIGATTEERGFDTTVQAGAVHDLLSDARALVPLVDELELVEAIAGLRPASPDNGPFIGWTRVRGLAVASGHYRNGVLLTPVTADAIGALLVGEPVPEAVRRFDVRRAERAGWIDAG
ncbi:MAG TPA: glycine oxidase ThiO [Acidimicrobiales bacterium]